MTAPLSQKELRELLRLMILDPTPLPLALNFSLTSTN